jgi:hypothetical protein
MESDPSKQTRSRFQLWLSTRRVSRCSPTDERGDLGPRAVPATQNLNLVELEHVDRPYSLPVATTLSAESIFDQR